MNDIILIIAILAGLLVFLSLLGAHYGDKFDEKLEEIIKEKEEDDKN